MSIGCGRYVVLYLSVGAFACVGKCRSYGAQSAFVCVSPGFYIGLRPHFTLGYAAVSPLQGSLSDWAFAVLCCGIVFVKCVLGCVNELLRSVVFLYLFVVVLGRLFVGLIVAFGQ